MFTITSTFPQKNFTIILKYNFFSHIEKIHSENTFPKMIPLSIPTTFFQPPKVNDQSVVLIQGPVLIAKSNKKKGKPEFWLSLCCEMEIHKKRSMK